MADEREVLVEVKNLEVTYGSGRKAYKAVKNANFTIYKGEAFGLVGESGSGKSTIGRSVIRLYNPTAGKIRFDGTDISGKLSARRDLDCYPTREDRALLASAQPRRVLQCAHPVSAYRIDRW